MKSKNYLSWVIASLVSLVFLFQNCKNQFSSQKVDLGSLNSGSASANSSYRTEFIDESGLTSLNYTAGPQDGSVLQRQANNKSDIVLSFDHLRGQYDAYFWQILKDSVVVENSGIQHINTATSSTLQPSADKTATQIRVVFYKPGEYKPAAYWKSAKFYVGDVYIVAGQSNSANSGESPQKTQYKFNRGFNTETNTWSDLNDPVGTSSHWEMKSPGGENVFVKSSARIIGPGGSPWPLLADRLADRSGVAVGITSIGWGGATMSDWLNGGNATYGKYLGLSDVSKAPALQNRLVEAFNRFPKCNFKSVLWIQGESDSYVQTDKDIYKNSVIKLKQDVDQKAGCSSIWYVAQASYMPPSFAVPIDKMNQIHIAQTEIQGLPNLGFRPGPDNDSMIDALYRFDQLHFSNDGLLKNAEMWFDKLK